MDFFAPFLIAESNSFPAAIALCSLAIAFVVGVLGPFVSWKIAKKQIDSQKLIVDKQLDVHLQTAEKQIRATVRSTNRQHWINSLREDLSDLIAVVMRSCSLAHQIYSAREFLKAATNDNDRELVSKGLDDHRIQEDKIYDAGRDCTQLLSRIELRLNPNEDDHDQLLKACKKLASIVIQEDFVERSDPTQTAACVTDVLDLAKPILKKEWIRVRDVQ